ncbi:hypothetical protein CTAYLR_006994 [Chrysophaeum taylorii]|uniref:histidine kinase n=1 Tax=Chrysophaeum taylorii TaxID=2483200 RepID=A0AAD7U9R2_9STRA|nr:hypothetical protein CTAYLR_006994 [Chrysophaeum taylorii]
MALWLVWCWQVLKLKRSENPSWIASMTSSMFCAATMMNFASFIDTIHAPHRHLPIMCATVCTFIACVGHILTAVGAFKPAESPYGRPVRWERMGEWLATLPIIVVLMLTLGQQYTPRSRSETLMSVAVLEGSLVFAFVSLPFDKPVYLACNCVATVMFCWTFKISADRTRKAARIYELKNVYSKHASKIERCKDAATKTLLPGLPRIYPKNASTSAIQLLWEQDITTLFMSAAMAKMCSITWTVFVVATFAGILQLYSVAAEETMTLIVDAASKLMLSTMLTRLHMQTQSQEKLLHLLLQAEERANSSFKQFLRYVCHEVRVPLNSVSIGIEAMIEHETLTSLGKEVASNITESVRHMSETLDDVLSFQKIEEGAFELVALEFSPVDMTRSVVKTLENAAKNKAVTILTADVVEPPYSPLKSTTRLVGDSVRLRQVIASFVSNAIKFSASGQTITVSAGLRQVKDEQQLPEATSVTWPIEYTARPVGLSIRGSRDLDDAPDGLRRVFAAEELELFVSVADEGVGISQSHQARLFQPFFQIRPGDVRAGRGTGLGLAISRQIIERHAGTIGAFSAGEGTGSTFWFKVRVGAALQPRPDANTTSLFADSLSSTTPDSLALAMPLYQQCVSEDRSVRSLVTDDVESNRRLCAYILKKLNFCVDLAENGQEAVDKVQQAAARRKPYDVIVTDVVMPIKSGDVAIREIRDSGHGPDVLIIIALTGNAFEEDRRSLMECGANDVLNKPATISQIRTCLARWGCVAPGVPRPDGVQEASPTTTRTASPTLPPASM